jgi:hypothetical protein
MIAHQTIARNRDAVLHAVAPKKIEVQLSIAIVEEYGLAAIAALGDVVPTAWDHDSRYPAH